MHFFFYSFFFLFLYQHGITASFLRYMHYPSTFAPRLSYFAPRLSFFHPLLLSFALLSDPLCVLSEFRPLITLYRRRTPKQIRNNHPPQHRTRSRVDIEEDIEHERSLGGSRPCVFFFFYSLYYLSIISRVFLRLFGVLLNSSSLRFVFVSSLFSSLSSAHRMTLSPSRPSLISMYYNLSHTIQVHRHRHRLR